MNVYNTYLQKQSALCDLLAEQASDSSHSRWSVANKYSALNHAIRNLGNRLRSPYVYELTSYVNTTYEYTLPAYVQGPFILQHANTNEYYWTDYSAYRVYPTSTGGIALRFEYAPPADQARIIYWGTNSPIPTELPVTSAEIDGDDTSVTLTTVPNVGRSGFIKIDAEWIQYSGVTETASTLTLNNLLRGIAGSTAATHAVASAVEWGIAVYNMTAYNQILAEAQAYLHQLYLVKASEQERDKHMTMLRYTKQVAEEMLPSVMSPTPSQMRLSERAMGGNTRYVSNTQCIYSEI